MRTTMRTETSSGLCVEPLSGECDRILRLGHHGMIGVSLANSYFSPARLGALMQWALNLFDRVEVVYVDAALDEMYIANGRTTESAEKSVKGRVRDVRRTIRRAMDGLDAQTERLRVRALTDLIPTSTYQAVRAETNHALEHDPDLSPICGQMVNDVVASRLGDADSVTPDHLRAGLNYVKAEAPIMVNSPSIFDVPSSVSVYHRSMPIFEYFAMRKGQFRAAHNQGYVTVTPASEG
jgi:cyclo(L-tyrosyl-L-tyrosyl) synthase